MMDCGLKQVSMNNFLNTVKKNKQLHVKLQVILLAVFSLFLVGCNDQAKTVNEAKQSTQVKAQKAQVKVQKAQVKAKEKVAEVIVEPERTYLGEHNYTIKRLSEKTYFPTQKDLTVMYQEFPQYFVNKAKEWPKEDLNDASSYDLPRFQFAWGNTLDRKDKYESGLKIWSMKTDGTDLRLVSDATIDMSEVSNLARSPNNRYASWAGSGGYKKVYDLKTGALYSLSTATSPSTMVWSQDSRYLYMKDTKYPHGIYYGRWDSETKELVKVDFEFNNFSYITNDTATSVNFYGVYKQNLVTGKGVLLKASKTLEQKKRLLDIRSISPDRRYAWGSSYLFGFLFDLEKQTVTKMSSDYTPAQILGKNAHYSSLSKMTQIIVVDRKDKRLWKWRAFHNGHISGDAILYNGLANDGLWFKNK